MKIIYEIQSYNVALCAECRHPEFIHDEDEGCMMHGCPCKEKPNVFGVDFPTLDGQDDKKENEEESQ